MIRRLSGAPLTAKGFRPFFLLAAAFAFSILPIWMLDYGGVLDLNGYFDATYWHAHEMLFGFATGAVLATSCLSWPHFPLSWDRHLTNDAPTTTARALRCCRPPTRILS